MDFYLYSALFAAWYVLALVVSEKVAKNRKIGEEWAFFISFMLSPVVGLAATLLSPKKSS